MIQTPTQLKAKVRNLSGGDSMKAQTLIRNYMMERFLERIACSKYREHFVLKGGMLVANLVGLETRATMDIDATVQSLNLSKEDAVKIIEDVIAVPLDDGIQFQTGKVADIMEEHDYPGVCITLETALGKLRQTVKIDISTGDVLTPGAVEYTYWLMFEDRAISLRTYNLETLLAEKLETIMARDTLNTRMRDFYDIYVITGQKTYDRALLKQAFLATSEKRNTMNLLPVFGEILRRISADETMRQMWERYRSDAFFVGELFWEDVMKSVRLLAECVL